MSNNEPQNKTQKPTQAEQVEAAQIKAAAARQLQDNPLLTEILEGMRRSVLNELESGGINVDESRKIRLFDYYQITGLVQKQILAYINDGEYQAERMRNVLQFKQLP